MYDVRFALDGAILCRIYQAGYMQAAYWDPGQASSPYPKSYTNAVVELQRADLALFGGQ